MWHCERIFDTYDDRSQETLVLPCQICQFGSSFANSWNFDWILFFFNSQMSHMWQWCVTVYFQVSFLELIFSQPKSLWKLKKLKESILIYLYSIEVVAGLGCHCDKLWKLGRTSFFSEGCFFLEGCFLFYPSYPRPPFASWLKAKTSTILVLHSDSSSLFLLHLYLLGLADDPSFADSQLFILIRKSQQSLVNLKKGFMFVFRFVFVFAQFRTLHNFVFSIGWGFCTSPWK